MPINKHENDDRADTHPTLRYNAAERAALLADIAAYQAARRPCPSCGMLNAHEVFVCTRCGADLVEPAQTGVLTAVPSVPTVTTGGEALLDEAQPITLLTGTSELELPVLPRLILGRRDQAVKESDAHVDLTPYKAWDSGVSRHHIEIDRKEMLIYVADLGSTNGTFLNGARLAPYEQHLLRNGDELQLSRLRLKVRF